MIRLNVIHYQSYLGYLIVGSSTEKNFIQSWRRDQMSSSIATSLNVVLHWPGRKKSVDAEDLTLSDAGSHALVQPL